VLGIELIAQLVGAFRWPYWYYVANELTSAAIQEIMEIPSNPIPTITIACSDSYLVKSNVDQHGTRLPPGVYQFVG